MAPWRWICEFRISRAGYVEPNVRMDMMLIASLDEYDSDYR